MQYDFSAFSEQIVSRARAKRINILARRERYPGEHDAVRTDAYLYELCEESVQEQIAACVCDGNPIARMVYA